MTYPIALGSAQWAREAVKGTDLPATSVMIVENFDFASGSVIVRPATARGLLVRNRGHEMISMFGGNWSASGPMVYEQLQNWLCMVENVATPTGPSPYIWTHTRNPAANAAPASFTFERRETDAATPYTQVGHYGMMSRLLLSGAGPDELVRFEAEGFCRKIQIAEAFTAALTMPTPEFPPYALCKVYIDSTWAALGSTQVTSQVLAWSVEHLTGLIPRVTADGRTDLDFNVHDINSGEVGINASITCLLGAQYPIEQAAAAAKTLRAVRIQIDGSGGRQLQIDFLAKYEQPEIPEFGEDEGGRTVVLNLVDSTDGTNFLRYKLTNLVATLS